VAPHLRSTPEERLEGCTPLTVSRIRVEGFISKVSLCFEVLRAFCRHGDAFRDILSATRSNLEVPALQEFCMRIETAEKLAKGGCTDLQHSFEEADKAYRVLAEMSRPLEASKNPRRLVEACRALLEVSRICLEDLRKTLREIRRIKCAP